VSPNRELFRPNREFIFANRELTGMLDHRDRHQIGDMVVARLKHLYGEIRADRGIAVIGAKFDCGSKTT
jgi:hypothetical protein